MAGLVSLGLRYNPPTPTENDLREQARAERVCRDGVKMTLNEFLSSEAYVQATDGLGANPTATKLLQSNQDWVYAAVSAISGRIMNLGYYLQLKIRRGSGKNFAVEYEDVEDHVLLDLLANPNEITSGGELLWLLAGDLELTGNCFWWLEPEGKTGYPSKIWRMPPDRVWIIWSADGRQPLQYIFNVGSHGTPLPPDQVCHFRLPGANALAGASTMHGSLSPLQASARAMDLNLFTQIYQSGFYRNNARPDFIVTFPAGVQVSRETVEAFWSDWRSKHQGLENAHLPAVLSGGADIKTLQLSDSDRRFVEVSGMTRDKILACFKVPASKIGLTTDSNRSNSEAADYTFNRECIAPLASIIASQVNKSICKRYYQYGKNAELVFTFNDPVPQNEEWQLTRIERMVRLGLVTPNEAAQELGYEEFDGGDQRLIQTGLMPFDQVGQAPPPLSLPLGAKPGVAKTKAVNKRTRYKGLKAIDLYREVTAEHKATGKVPLELHAEIYARHVKGMKKNVKTYRVALADAFKAQYERVVGKLAEALPKQAGRIDRSKSPEAVAKFVRKDAIPAVSSDLWDRQYEIDVFASLSKKYLTAQFLENFAAMIFELTGEQKRQLTAAAVAWLERTSRTYASAAIQTTESELKDIIRDGLINGASVETVRDRIFAKYFGESETEEAYAGGWTDWRAEAIARTELNAAANAGNHEGMDESGVVERTQWISALDERTRRAPQSEFDHWAANGEIVASDGLYHRTGEPMKYPGDPDGHPGNYINCRCSDVPYIEGDSSNENEE